METLPNLFEKDAAYNHVSAGRALPHYREPNGRFSTEDRARILKAEKDAKFYKMMYESERRRMNGMADIIRGKDEVIARQKAELITLRSRAHKNK